MSGADLEYQAMLARAGVNPASPAGYDAARLEQMRDIRDAANEVLGNVMGPDSSTDLYIVVFNGTTGKIIKQGTKRIADLIAITEKGAVSGVASLDGSGKVPSDQLPSYVDDILEYANFAALPVSGTTGLIYVTLDNNKTFRWSGSAYVEVSPSEVISVAGKNGIVTLFKADVGLGNVDNTSDASKPVSMAHQTALDLKTEAHTFSVTGAVAVATGKSRIYVEGNYTIVTVRASVNTAPTGASLICDVNKNGTTIYTTQANRPTIAISGNTATANAPDVTTLVSGDYITVDVDQVGSTVAGSDLTVTIRLRRTS